MLFTADFREETEVMIPKDPVMLLSFVNMKLRDFYGSPEVMCEDLELDVQEVT